MSSSENRQVFLGYLRERWLPDLRSAGFRGSRWRLRRYRSPYIHCIGVQTRADGAGCFVNLGFHLDFLPPSQAIASAERVDVKKVDVHDCEIRGRLAPEGASDHWWSFGSNRIEAAVSGHDLIRVFAAEGEPFFQSLSDLPGPFDGVVAGDILSRRVEGAIRSLTAERASVLLGRVHIHLGNAERARGFGEAGLALLEHERAPSVKKALREIVEQA